MICGSPIAPQDHKSLQASRLLQVAQVVTQKHDDNILYAPLLKALLVLLFSKGRIDKNYIVLSL